MLFQRFTGLLLCMGDKLPRRLLGSLSFKQSHGRLRQLHGPQMLRLAMNGRRPRQPQEGAGRCHTVSQRAVVEIFSPKVCDWSPPEPALFGHPLCSKKSHYGSLQASSKQIHATALREQVVGYSTGQVQMKSPAR